MRDTFVCTDYEYVTKLCVQVNHFRSGYKKVGPRKKEMNRGEVEGQKDVSGVRREKEKSRRDDSMLQTFHQQK